MQRSGDVGVSPEQHSLSPRSKKPISRSSSGSSEEISETKGRMDRYADVGVPRQQHSPSPHSKQPISRSSSGSSDEIRETKGTMEFGDVGVSRQQYAQSAHSLSPHSASPHSMGRMEFGDVGVSRQEHLLSPHSASPRSMGRMAFGDVGVSRQEHSLSPHSGSPRSMGRMQFGDVGVSRQPHSPSPHSASPQSKGRMEFGDVGVFRQQHSPSLSPHSASPDRKGRIEFGDVGVSRQQYSTSPHSASPHSVKASSRSSSGNSEDALKGRMDRLGELRGTSLKSRMDSSEELGGTSRMDRSGELRGISLKSRMDSSEELGGISRQQLSPSPLKHLSRSRSSSGGGSSDGESWAGAEVTSALDSAAVRNMVIVTGRYARDVLSDTRGRQELRERCSELLQEEHGVNVQYAEQAVLANLDWGIDGLEKAVKATNPETRAARLEHTEKMLQVAVLLDPKKTTAGVPNSYLSAWASYYMALVWKLRNNDRNAALCLLDVFLLEPSHARRSFVPALWEQLFRPHMANIEGWYRGELDQIMTDSPPLSSVSMFPIPKPQRNRANSTDSSSRSFSKGSQEDFRDASCFSSSPAKNAEPSAGSAVDHLAKSDESIRRSPTLAPDQMMRMELLNKLYQDSLDDNTKQYAQYYKDWMAFEAADSGPAPGGEIEPTFPRTINPTFMNPSSFTERLHEESSGQARPSGRSSALGKNEASSNADAGDVQVLQKRVSRQFSMDHEDADLPQSGFLSKDAYVSEGGRGNGYERPIEERSGDGNHQNFDLRSSVMDSIAMGDLEEDGNSVPEVEKGAGVYLDGEQLTEDELLQVWEEISEGRISMEEANEFVNQLTGSEGQPLDFEKLSEFADALKARLGDHAENQQVEISGSPERGSEEDSKYENTPHLDIEEEEEEAEVKIKEEFDRPDSPSSVSGLNSQSSRAAVSSRISFVNVQQHSQEQARIPRPPKDFVCPITNQLFHDPVTLETGQTYERGAIKEWLDRGNVSCPITRQMLKNPKLPKTNYVLKRLVDNWRDDHPEYFGDSTRAGLLSRATPGRIGRVEELELEVFSSGFRFNKASGINDEIQRPIRPKVPLLMRDEASSASLEAVLRQLMSAVDALSRTEDLPQSESAALVVAQIWVDSKCDETVAATLSKAGVVEALMDVLSRSKKDEVLRAIVCLLSDLITKDEFTRHTILRTDPEVESVVSVLKNARIPQVAVLLHLLKVPASQVSSLKVVPFLVSVVKHGQFFTEGTVSISISPKAAAVYLLEQLVTTLDQRTNMANADAIVRAEGVPSLLERLEAKTLEEKVTAVAVLWACLQSDGSCRVLMVQNLKLTSLIGLLHSSKEQARTVAIFFLAELIRLNRRRVIEKVLQGVLQEGVLNTMHVLMLHLQMSPLEQRPLVAGLLLQLDLLADPQKHSVYREEAVEALVDALNSEDNSKVQLEAAKALVCLGGRYTPIGKSATEATLLKAAGFEDDSAHSANSDRRLSSVEMSQGWQEEKKAADEWDHRMAMALLGSGKALIEALGVVLPSKSSKTLRPCLVATAWLTSVLRQTPDPAILSSARNCFLSSLVSIMQSTREVEVRVLACLSLHNIVDDPAGIQQLITFGKELLGPLRRLRRYTWISSKLLEMVADNAYMDLNAEMWEHGEVGKLDASQSGETRALYYFKGYLYSGHTDASIKIWAVKGRAPQMVQEVREHRLAVLCLTGLEDESKLFSGAADKTVRIWVVRDEQMRCIRVIDVKEAVHSVAVNSSFICIIPQGVGLKVFDEMGSNMNMLNPQKHVQSITFGDNRIYCGCTDNSIQEIDPESGTAVTIQPGMRSLRGKRAIYSLAFFNNQLAAGGTNVDGIPVKIWRVPTRSLDLSVATEIDVRFLAISEDLIYLASNIPTGIVEVWLLESNQKVASFTFGSKILSIVLVGDTLYTGSTDGILRVLGKKPRNSS